MPMLCNLGAEGPGAGDVRARPPPESPASLCVRRACRLLPRTAELDEGVGARRAVSTSPADHVLG